jgi:radical SAM superfamily enzyme YgiQ (UPF0313 family)
MYRDKTFRLRDLSDVLADIEEAGRRLGPRVEKVFVMDGDALTMPMDHWGPILEACTRTFPSLRRISSYAMARNVLAKTDDELATLASAGLGLLYLGPESGDDPTLKKIAKGDNAEAHVEAARRAKRAGMELSVIALLGIGQDRTKEHAEATAALVTAMDPAFFSALTVTVVPNTPLATLATRGKFTVPSVTTLLTELRTMIDLARPTNAVFRTNHASNYLPLAGRLPHDRVRLVHLLDEAIAGRIPLRPERTRGL